MAVFDHLLDESEEYRAIRAAAEEGISPVHVSGVMDAEKAHLLYLLSKSTGRPLFCLTAGEIQARRLSDDLSVFLPDCTQIRTKEVALRKCDAAGRDTLYEKFSALAASSGAGAVVTSIAALLQKVTPKDVFEENRIMFRVGGVSALPELAGRLTDIGYERVDTVEGKGQFAIRGGILDIYSPDAPDPIRMEFFDDEIDSIRTFDPMTQLSTDRLEETSVIPAGDIAAEGSLLSYVPENALVVFDEPLRVSEGAKAVALEMEERIRALLSDGNEEEIDRHTLLDYPEMLAKIAPRMIVSVASLSINTPDFRPERLFQVTVKSMQPYSGNTELLLQDIAYYKEKNYRIVVMAGAKERMKSLSELFFDKGFTVTTEDALPERGTVLMLPGSFSGGYEYPLIRTVVISDRELLAKEKKHRRKRSSGAAIGDYSELLPGDLVVHDTHGIGRFSGVSRINAAGRIKDYLKIVYRGDDVLYVPVGQLDMLHKYKSSLASGDETEVKVRLNKLGGAEWKATKTSVRKNVAALAEKLVKLYAERSAMAGHAFPEDSVWQREFEAEFPYEETEDQLRSTEEIKEDMTQPRPMDRLLCGDVGFGKTEVAMRAAFKCVTDNRQVAYLVPTTVLASQQYAGFVQRMQNYPVSVEMLSRFRSKKAQADIVRRVRTGEIDILIGTHRMLQKDVAFKNLGLLIIDEEQRFGVAHKEAIKELKKDVDVLTLSATPIPRSLNMAMIGIRDMSVLTAPPEDRLPVQTFAMEYNEAVIDEAIGRELARGGQVYYLFNRVAGIYKVAERLQSRFPDTAIGVGHGQMNETELEDIMMRMVEGELDILVCTTIIETGLDIPNVNTIVIEDADRMGLAQLYQLRGRVGRSNRLAYAYLTYRRDKVLSEVAEKRLKAIREFTEFGSGFRIAMRDLELRGAGNVLGPEQSGFMSSVGYEVYCDILAEAVSEAKGIPIEEKTECLIDLEESAYIPETYIASPTTRIQIYKKIAGIESLSDSYAVQEELEDRFGDIPEVTSRLIDVALIRAEARKAGIEEISQKGEKLFFFVSENLPDIPGIIARLNGLFRGRVMFSVSGRPCIHLRCGALPPKEIMENIKKVLQNLKCDG